MQETWVQFLGWEDSLEEGMATHSSILAWRIPMDWGAWWATGYGVAESDMTKQLNTVHDTITVFLIVLSLLCVVLFLLCFLPWEVPLAFVVRLLWQCWILLTFACLESFWFSIKSEGESCWVEYSLLWVLPFHHFIFYFFKSFYHS